MNSFDLMIQRYKQEIKEFDDKVNAGKRNLDLQESVSQNNDSAINNPILDKEIVDEFDEILPVMASMQEANEVSEQISLDGQGSLIVQAFMSSEVYPIVSALVTVKKNNSSEILFQGYTDVNGKTVEIKLPAPSEKLSQQPTNITPYALYDIEVSQPKYKTRKYLAVPVFDEVESIQPVQLVPVFSTNVADDVIVTRPPTIGGEYNG